MNSITELHAQLVSGEVSALELVTRAQKLSKQQQHLNIFVNETWESAMQTAEQVEQVRENELLSGIPTAVKDNFNIKGTPTTASSNMLENYVSPYTATVVEKLEQSQAVVIGKTNMDAFAHGSSTATSDFGHTLNPANEEYYPGGSSGGSAAAVAAGIVPYAIGSETAGSIRQPASWCGVTGVVPTYGRVSRYGLIAMGSSLDRPGPIANSVADCSIVLDAISGQDRQDATSVAREDGGFFRNLNPEIKQMKVGIPKAYWDGRVDDDVREIVHEAVQVLEKQGVQLIEVELMDPKYAMAVYTIICRSEISSNLARLDGIRYGFQSAEKYEDVLDAIAANRGEGFGPEAKQRSLTGTYTLSAGYYDAYYKKAQQVRNLIKQDLQQVFAQVDAIVSPTAPTTAVKIGDDIVDDPLFGERSDMLVEASALAGMPSLSIPVGESELGLPIGMQMIADQWQEQKILNLAHAYQLLAAK